MPRPIKFRVWDPVNLVFYYNYTPYNFMTPSLITEENRFLGSLKDFIWQQYTGLKDKNGREIYEGDIVLNHWYDCNNNFIGELWIVKFGEHDTDFSDVYSSIAYGWYLEQVSRVVFSSPEEGALNNLNGDLEVLGNIYEDPELLKGTTHD